MAEKDDDIGLYEHWVSHESDITGPCNALRREYNETGNDTRLIRVSQFAIIRRFAIIVHRRMAHSRMMLSNSWHVAEYPVDVWHSNRFARYSARNARGSV